MSVLVQDALGALLSSPHIALSTSAGHTTIHSIDAFTYALRDAARKAS